jgi:predicted nucleic acid-binding protein
MDKPRFVFDSTIVINHLNKKLDVEAFLAASVKDAEKIVSIITFVETLAKPNMTADEEQEARQFLASCKCENILPAIRDETIALRRAFPKRKLPDCFIADTAIALNATILSNDPHLLNLAWPGLTVIPV